MKIKRMSWRNFRSLNDGEIVADGHNVTVSGRNGAGKSSIAAIVPFVLFGRVTAKGFDEFGLTLNRQLPEAEVEFVDGQKFRRAVTADNKNHVYINGRDVSVTNFNAQVFNLTGGGSTLLLNLFEFPNMRWQDQRDFLLRNFATDEELPSPEEIRGRIKRFNSEQSEIDARLKELYAQLKEAPDKSIREIDEQIAALEVERSSLQATRQLDDGKLDLARRAVRELEFQVHKAADRYKTLADCREELLTKYRAVKTTCPTCGARLKPEAVDKARSDIVALGRKTAAQASQAQTRMVQLQAQLEAARTEVAKLEEDAKSTVDMQTPARLISIGNQLDKLRTVRVQILQAQKLETRIHELDDRRRQRQVDIGDLDGELMTVDSRRQQLVRQKEADVNSKFQFVTFKLFKILSTTGETRETCEAMLGGVPYANLSKGERFKAACDILSAIQTKFNVQMPLMIDDAESYTPNSLVELPNQLFLFRVTDEDLKVEVAHD